MLRRINAGLFEEDEGSDIELAVQAQNNNGTEAAQFDYDSTVLGQDTVQGHPGCRIKIQPGTRQFRALVVFDPAAPPTARYDLFQVNAAGTLTPVGKSVTNTFGTPLIGFGIAGVPVAVAVPAGARAGRRKMPKRPRRAARKMTSARRGATTSRKPAAAAVKTVKAVTKKKSADAKRAVKAKRKLAPKRAKRIVKKKAKR